MRRLCWPILSIALLLVGLPLAAKRSPGPTLLLAPDESYETTRQGNRWVRLDTGAPLAIQVPGYRVDPGSPEEMARQYLRENWQSLGLQHGDLADLVHHATRVGKAGTTVRFQQTTLGVSVHGATIAVSLDPQGAVTFLTSTYLPATLTSAVATRSAAEARTAARALLGVTATPRWERTDLVAYYNRGETRLAHRVRQLSSEEPMGDWEILRDANTGEIFRVEDVALYGVESGDGDVFLPDPLSTSGAAYNDPGYPDNGDQDSPQLVAEIINQALPVVTEAPAGTFNLVSGYAEIRDTESPFKGLFSQSSSSWSFTREPDGFEAVNTFYHIDRFMRYMNETLGVAVAPIQYVGGVRFDPHGLGGDDNSHYSSGSGEVAFGEGGVDDAEDADVVIHELGHGIHDWVTNGGLSQVNGLSEGTGDYFAQSYSRGLMTAWTPADPAYHWVFSWDGHNEFWNGRITNYTGVYPDDLTGSIHTDGQIWATCNMRVWDAIGQGFTDTAMLEGLAMTNSGTNQEQAAAAVLQAAINLGYNVANLFQMQSIYQACGYDVSVPGLIFADGFESGDTTSWSTP